MYRPFFKVVPETGSVSFQIHWIFVGFRVNNYINSGLSPNPVGPDGGNLQKKHLRLGLEQDISPLTDVLFRQDGFEVGISSVPKIGFCQIRKYLTEEVKFKKQLSVENPKWTATTLVSLVKCYSLVSRKPRTPILRECGALAGDFSGF